MNLHISATSSTYTFSFPPTVICDRLFRLAKCSESLRFGPFFPTGIWKSCLLLYQISLNVPKLFLLQYVARFSFGAAVHLYQTVYFKRYQTVMSTEVVGYQMKLHNICAAAEDKCINFCSSSDTHNDVKPSTGCYRQRYVICFDNQWLLDVIKYWQIWYCMYKMHCNPSINQRFWLKHFTLLSTQLRTQATNYLITISPNSLIMLNLVRQSIIYVTIATLGLLPSGNRLSD